MLADVELETKGTKNVHNNTETPNISFIFIYTVNIKISSFYHS